MATYTSNLSLKKPAQSDKIRIADLNGNADNIDAAIGADFGQSSKPSINAAINSLADGLAIVAQGDVHAAISAGQFVYVRNHSTLAEGLYVASTAISANAALSGTNLTADTSGGLNALNSNVTHTYYSGDLLVTPLDTSSTVKSFEKIGKNIYITMRGDDRAHTENETFMVLPSGYRPGGDRYFPIVISSSNGGFATGIMKANGDVQIWSSNPPYGRIIIMLSYAAD